MNYVYYFRYDKVGTKAKAHFLKKILVYLQISLL